MMRRIWMAAMLALILASCATHAPRGASGKPEARAVPAPKAEKITLSVPAGVLSDVVREASKEAAGGLVVMYGMENLKTPDLEFRNATLHEIAQRLAKTADCTLHEGPHYDLMLPNNAAYEPLTQLSLEGKLLPKYTDMAVSMDFGAGVPLYNVCYMISRSLGITVVADNVLAETRTGQIALNAVPLQHALEAVLQSARVAPGMFDVDCTDEYIFLHAAGPTVPKHLLINGDALSASERKRLARTVSVTLPEQSVDPSKVPHYAGGVPLRALLDRLSTQLGMTVKALPDLGDVPINPVVMNDVTVETAMDLLIRQWPAPLFGYEVRDNTILIRQRPLEGEATRTPAP